MSLHLDIPDRPADWADCHTGPLARPELTARAAFERGLRAVPAWVGPAMALRNLLVRPFGLRTGVGGPPGAGPAGFLARLPVLTDRPDLFETGLTDRHLTFTLRVETAPARIALRTRIWFHSAFGRLYLRAVLTAHNAIVRRLLRSLGKTA